MINRKMQITAAHGLIDVLKLISLKNLDIKTFKNYFYRYSVGQRQPDNHVYVYDVYNVYLANVKFNNLNISNELLTFDEFAIAFQYLLYNNCIGCLTCNIEDETFRSRGFHFNKYECISKFGAHKEL